jgi:C-terminal processing protease CtpA/Prc
MHTRRLIASLLLTGLLAGPSIASEPGGADAGDIPRLIRALGANAFADRESAQQQLLRLGETDFQTVARQCLKAYLATTDPEIKHRLHQTLDTLVETHLFNRPRGYLGVQIAPSIIQVLDQQVLSAIAISGVIPDSAADHAGVLPGDRILKLDDLDLTRQPQTELFINHIQSKRPGDSVRLTLQRGEELRTLTVTLGELPDELKAQLLTETRKREFFRAWLDTESEKLGAPPSVRDAAN